METAGIYFFFFFQVYIEVKDVNDHIPQTEEPSYHPFIYEDSPPGTEVVTLKASDDDLAPTNITFSISKTRGKRSNFGAAFKTDTEFFIIDPFTGEFFIYKYCSFLNIYTEYMEVSEHK